jgi:hypothetical protein
VMLNATAISRVVQGSHIVYTNLDGVSVTEGNALLNIAFW